MAGQEAIYLTTPPGRIIWGDTHTKQTTGYQNKPIEPEKQQFQFGLAVRKDHPGTMPFLQALYAQAMGGYPTNAFIQGKIAEEWNSGFMAKAFAFKVRDGDKPNPTTGATNDNAKGCFVVSFGTQLPYKGAYGGAVDRATGQPYMNAYGQPIPVNSEIPLDKIKTGYWVDVHCSVKANGLTDGTAGIFINQSVVRLLGEDAEIVGGPSIEQAFGNTPLPTLPQGVGGNATPSTGGLPGAGVPQAVPSAAQPSAPGGYAPPVNNAPLPGAGAPGGLPGTGAAGMPGLPTVAPSNGTQPYPAFGQPPGLPGQ